MSDWKKQLQNNFSGRDSSTNRTGNYGRTNEGPPALPAGYLQGGYFDSAGYIKQELLLEAASDIARKLGKDSKVEMTSNQLRKFYNHVKIAEKAYLLSGCKNKLIVDIKALDAFVAEAKGKGKVPEFFYNFVKENVAKVATVEDVLQGFIPHFQAVVAYYTYHYPQK
jgi:CRISPR-associated protein Csm2